MSIKLSDERCEEIKQKVVQLFEKYNIFMIFKQKSTNKFDKTANL